MHVKTYLRHVEREKKGVRKLLKGSYIDLFFFFFFCQLLITFNMRGLSIRASLEQEGTPVETYNTLNDPRGLVSICLEGVQTFTLRRGALELMFYGLGPILELVQDLGEVKLSGFYMKERSREMIKLKIDK